jgi:geranylgeranyl diphosphate synthase type II
MSRENDLLAERFPQEYEAIEAHLHEVLTNWSPAPSQELGRLWQSVEYSVFSSGKRFRPLLSVLTAQALKTELSQVLPVASAVELIHTYSLIHDDLPLMDNDDMRRGRPTNHKVYGDALALLAGDGLLTLAFFVVARGLKKSTSVGEVVEKIAAAAGLAGMVGGQALDISAEHPDEQTLHTIHQLKTGALIRVAVEAAAVVCGAKPFQQAALTDFGRALGLAFQVADDLQDAGIKAEKVNFVHRLGAEQTAKLLRKATADGLKSLESFGKEADGLRYLLEMNEQRISF